MNPVYIIDHSNFCYKFRSVHKYAKKEVSGVDIDTSILVGYLRALKLNYIKDIIIVIDGTPKRSKDLLPSYKGQRSKEGDETLQVPRLEILQFLSAVGSIIGKNIKIVCAPNQEADQVISSLVHIITGNLPQRSKFISMCNTYSISEDKCLRYIKDYITNELDLSMYDSAVIGTTDSDMFQLMRFEGVCIDSSTSGKVIAKQTPEAVHNLPPSAIALYKSIYGDISDNVPPINLDYPKDNLLKMLTKVRDNETLNSVINTIRTSNSEIAKKIRKDQASFERNLEITKLDFYSFPIQISFPSYDIRTTIDKYGLRL